MSISPGYNLNETFNQAEIEFLHNDGKIDFIDHIEPYEVNDKFVPNKHAIVFKEFIYVLIQYYM